jgi:hypothetical protein
VVELVEIYVIRLWVIKTLIGARKNVECGIAKKGTLG